MTSQISISNKKNNSELPFSKTAQGGRFNSRAFMMQSKTDNSKQPGLKTSLIQAEKYGHHLNKTDLANQSNTPVVQPKLDNQPIQFGLKKPGKQKQLEELRKNAPGKTPMEILEQNPKLMVKKRDPFRSGDHSPSLANYNKTTDGKIRATGRAHAKNQKGNHAFNIGQHQIPTMHFQNNGAASHSTLTSLRAAGGVGEHTSHSFDNLLDKTGSAYHGKPKLPDGAPLKVHVRRPGTASNSRNNLTNRPVDPSVGQQIINMDMRESSKKRKPEQNALGKMLSKTLRKEK